MFVALWEKDASVGRERLYWNGQTAGDEFWTSVWSLRRVALRAMAGGGGISREFRDQGVSGRVVCCGVYLDVGINIAACDEARMTILEERALLIRRSGWSSGVERKGPGSCGSKAVWRCCLEGHLGLQNLAPPIL